MNGYQQDTAQRTNGKNSHEWTPGIHPMHSFRYSTVHWTPTQSYLKKGDKQRHLRTRIALWHTYHPLLSSLMIFIVSPLAYCVLKKWMNHSLMPSFPSEMPAGPMNTIRRFDLEMCLLLFLHSWSWTCKDWLLPVFLIRYYSSTLITGERANHEELGESNTEIPLVKSP